MPSRHAEPALQSAFVTQSRHALVIPLPKRGGLAGAQTCFVEVQSRLDEHERTGAQVNPRQASSAVHSAAVLHATQRFPAASQTLP